MKECYKAKIMMLIVLLALGYPEISGGENRVQAKQRLSVKKVKVGKRISPWSSKSGALYKSANSRIASVDSSGKVTGKKTGKVKITQTIQNKKKTYLIKVVKNPRKPASLPVTLDEVTLQDQKIQKRPSGNMVYSARIRNTSSKGTIKKISYHFQIQVQTVQTDSVMNSGEAAAATGGAVSPTLPAEEKKTVLKKKTVTITAKNMGAGKTSGRIQCEGDYTGVLSNMKLTGIDLYTGSARYHYNAAEGKYFFDWASKDQKKPKITGLVKGKSYTGHNDPYLSVYTDQKKNWNPVLFVSAVDDRDGKVRVKADTSRINWRKTGTYTINFSAEDKAGNVAKSWAKVRVIVPGTAESIADQVLRSITRKGWSDEKKARAIYKYVRGRCSYVNNAPHKDWRTTAVQGIRYQSGDCYTYYAVARLLLTRAGIPNVMINRYPTPRGMRHFWNLTYVKGGWYHFDTTPRHRKESFCLWTDAQLFGYSSGYTFQFKRSAYVKRSSKRI